MQARLDEILPDWLGGNGYDEVLQALAKDRSLGSDLRPTALTWLDAAGTDTTDLEKVPDLLIDAYYLR